jgi:hypothetical protein
VFIYLLTDTQALHIDYTFGRNIRENPYHVPVIRSRLIKALPPLVYDVYDEVVTALNELIPITEGNHLNN